MFGTISAKMGNGIWTEEIIPAEIEPPPRNAARASGNRVRLGAFPVTNAGDAADLVVAFNEQALMGRVLEGELKPGCRLLGMRPVLAVTNSVINALVMGLATTVVVCMSSAIVALVRGGPRQVRIASFILTIAAFVTVGSI